MISVFSGFAFVVIAVAVGYVVGRSNVLGEHARHVLSRLIFFVLSPFLLFTILSTADVSTLFSTLLPVSALSALAAMAVFTAVAATFWRRGVGETVIGALSSGYTNAGNIGIPIALYLLGNAALAAPVTLVQLLIFMPVAFVILDAQTHERRSIWRVLGQTFRNPMLIGALLGVVFSLMGWTLPSMVAEPIASIGHACIPLMLIAYGISLHGQRVLTTVGRRRDVLVASVLNMIAMPVVAWALGTWVFDLSPTSVYAVTILAALPTAQNVFNFAQRYRVGEIVARDTIFVTTLASLPIMLVISLLLNPAI